MTLNRARCPAHAASRRTLGALVGSLFYSGGFQSLSYLFLNTFCCLHLFDNLGVIRERIAIGTDNRKIVVTFTALESPPDPED